MRHARQVLAALVIAAGPLSGEAQDVPLSSIDWLSDSLAEETALRPQRRLPPLAAGGAGVAPVTVTPLGSSLVDGVGLVDAASSGLPSTLWGASTTDEIAKSLMDWPGGALPAAQDALKPLLLARLDPPGGGGTLGTLLIARIDTLLKMGALDQAAALLNEAGTVKPELFRRAFDVALLQGREDEGCTTLRSSPGIAPSLPVRIFCLARSGDWSAAALTLETAAALGQLSPVEDTLLARFLDPQLAEDVAPLARLPAPSPLEWRMLEAIGERQPTSGLPRAFAHADLRITAGWKTRIEATERLVRAGALPADDLRKVYGERDAAASGGVWDRVDAVNALKAALEAEDAASVTQTLRPAWESMQRVGLGIAFAEIVSDCLLKVSLEGDAAALAERVALLSPESETAALNAGETSDAFAVALARGIPPPPDLVTGRSAVVTALGNAFSENPPPPPVTVGQLVRRDRLGLALIEALTIVARGAEADPGDLSGALAFLRTAGMEAAARQAALQIYLLQEAA